MWRQRYAWFVAGIVLLGCDEGGKTSNQPPARGSGQTRVDVPDLKLLNANTSDLKRTTVLPHEAIPIPEGKSAIWCSTWQMAWDALKRDVAGGSDLQLSAPAPAATVALLNGSPFSERDLAPGCRFARAGKLERGIIPAIQEEFGKAFPATKLAIELPTTGDGFLALAYLRKHVPFRIPFEPVRLTLPFLGGDRHPLWFGMSPDSTNSRKSEVLGQVQVLAEEEIASGQGELLRCPKTFFLEIDSADGRDQLYLARQAPGGSLEEKWKGVQEQAAHSKAHGLSEQDLLAIPKFNFALCHDFREFLGAPLRMPEATGPIAVARQTLDFRLDESGARVESYALLAGGLPKAYVLDRPFLLAMREKGASRPYLLMWIANDELFAEAAK